jgi:hypothetical protein
MIDRQHGRITFECDCCPEAFDADTIDFSEAWLMAKANGWRSKNIANEWLHSCGSPKCKLM